ncbi:protein of unknown function [Geodermatophilus dictyosporus]|uniref:DUF4190 domain-containing protein n=1 Tax=Geodermatophilus dictyosporus TaxID=1523247 RepID=A0A1I5TSB2_9ACTN|nr:DUF4190 domain-containing protein [Geodermatophilus dictyosporus]SFP85196.1 protein of unknown function [Geodermatophilus dictyosporus]
MSSSQDPSGPAPGQPPPYGAPPAYGPPGCGPQSHGPQSHGPPPGWPPYRRPTNTMAILALVLAFVAAPVGLVLGVLARRQIRRTGEEGDGLALAGIVVGGIGTALAAMGIVVAILALATVSASFAP